jgi:hypothetical protein
VARLADTGAFVLSGIIEIAAPIGLWKPAGRTAVEIGRAALPECFVGALLVVLETKAIEGPLLSFARARRWTGSGEFEGEVPTLVPAILLRFAWLDALVSNAEFEPPGGELGEASGGLGSEGRAIVRTDGVGQAKGLKESKQSPLHTFGASVGESDAAEQEATVGIHDGERVTAALTDEEVALEVDAPGSVGVRGVGQGVGGGRSTATATARNDEAIALEDGCERADGGQFDAWMGA